MNFHALRQWDTKIMFLAGPYGPGVGDTELDGPIVIPFDCDIVGGYMWNSVAGSSGTTEIDIKRQTASAGARSSIFSTTPKLSFSLGNSIYMPKIIASGQEASEPAVTGGGYTLPVFSVTQLDQFDSISLDLITAQQGGENCGFGLWIRPR